MSLPGRDAAWLAAVLGEKRDEIQDLEFDLLEIVQSTETYRVSWSDARRNRRTLILKVPTSGAVTLTGGEGANNLREVRFYQALAQSAGVRVPECRYARFADNGVDFALLLEDLTFAGSDDQAQDCSPESAELVVIELANLHATRWLDASLASHNWLTWTRNRRADAISRMPSLFKQFKQRYASALAQDVFEVGDRYFAALPKFYESQRSLPSTLVHGDLRRENLLLGGPDPVVFIDWQAVQIGPGALDLSYFLGSSLPSEVRRQHERSLVARYYEQLRSRGVKGYTLDECWHQYASMSFRTYLGGVRAAMSLVRTDRGDRVFTEMVARGAEQVRDLAPFAQLPV